MNVLKVEKNHIALALFGIGLKKEETYILKKGDLIFGSYSSDLGFIVTQVNNISVSPLDKSKHKDLQLLIKGIKPAEHGETIYWMIDESCSPKNYVDKECNCAFHQGILTDITTEYNRNDKISKILK